MKLKSFPMTAALLAALALVTLLARADTTHAAGPIFHPDIATVVDNPVTGAHSGISTKFNVGPELNCKNDIDDDGDGLVNDGCPPVGDAAESGTQCENATDDDGDGVVNDGCPTSLDVQFGYSIAYIPSEWGITPAKDIPIGTPVGRVYSLSTLGIVNSACDNFLQVEFIMLNASIDINDTMHFRDEDENGTDEAFEDKDFNGLKDSIEKYPDFIKRIIGDAQPIRRAAGITRVAQSDVLLQFLVFEPGTPLLSELPTDPELGYEAMTFLQDVGDPDRIDEPNPLTDYCSPLAADVITFGVSKDNGCTDDVPLDELDSICEVGTALLLPCDNYIDDDGDQTVNDGCPTVGDKPESGKQCEGGANPNDKDDDGDGWVNDGCPAIDEPEKNPTTKPNEGGINLITNPKEEGTYTFTTASLGQRDADGDGYENNLDTCPLITNVGDPRAKGVGDVDEDGLDAACDPNDMVTNSDQDGDGYVNRQDNCPLVANGEEGSNQKDSDRNDQGQPRPDRIGDDCDPNPGVPDGELLTNQLSSDVTIKAGSATSSGEEGGGGSSTIIIIAIAVVAAVVVVGGGGFYLMRRRGT